jgi:hypothetical protein
MAQSLQQNAHYRQALRAIGRHLDSEIAFNASILETEEGFTVRYQSSPHFDLARTLHFPWERLHDLLIFNSAGRGVPGKRKKSFGLWDNFDGGREDFFRALGTRLDDETASSVNVEELPDGIAISYVSPDRDNPLRTQKHHTVLNLDAIREVLRVAQRKRGVASGASS